MIRFLADENFRVPILVGLRRRQPDLDIVHIHELGMDETPDPDILVWAAAENRVVITHDAGTMPDYAYQRLRDGLPMPGMVVVPSTMPIGQAIEGLLLITGGSFADEWANLVRYLLPG